MPARAAASTPDDSPLSTLIPASWRAALASELASPEFGQLEHFLAEERSAGATIFPPRELIFAALDDTPLPDVRVVVVGQDPYPTAGNANGLAFSVTKGMKIPASLKNIFAGLAVDVGATAPSSGDLTPWAKQGVLLLNTVLTVREGAPNSHRKKGWEQLTRAMLECVNALDARVVFLCLGAQAKAMAEDLVDVNKHTILTAPHPSPLNGKAFVVAVEKDRPFTRINELLEQAGRGSIDWQIP